ncbi:MAG TPA: hypothetical protein VG326_17075 [Tepidisphaeraceae bacterium]|nr:hypothetical protein [Tepidisphaeraceae bacterium]
MSVQRHSRDEGPDGDEEAWDADDARRQKDQFAPPMEPCECFCLHCRRTFKSDAIWFQKIKGGRNDFDGFWMCPTPNCGGAGFTFDIFPVDPDHPANAGWFHDDDISDQALPWDDDDDDDDDESGEFFEDLTGDESEYDPSEPGYRLMEQSSTDDDIEGDEWKHGLEPGQRPEDEATNWVTEEEKKYDQPDERPREIDWTEREVPKGGGSIGEDDIPF